MQPSPILIFFITWFLFSCKSKKTKIETIAKLPSNKDTLWVDNAPYVELLDSTLDSTGYISALSRFAIQKLNLHAGKPYFDTSALFYGYNGRISFYQGHLFSKEKEKAVIQVHDEGSNPFLIFTNERGWKLRQVLYGYGRIDDSAAIFYDYNFDGIKDLAIIWNYSAGRCSCSDPGCYNLYLYNDVKDSLVHVPQIGQYLDFGVSEKEKALYLGEHCDGFYGKFQWQNGQLQKTEEFLFTERDVVNNKESWVLEHNQYENSTKIYSAKRKNAEMPQSWKQMFDSKNK